MAATVKPTTFTFPANNGNVNSVITADGAGGSNWATGNDYTRTVINNAASPYTVLIANDVLAVDCSGGAVEIRLPAISALTNNRKIYRVVDETGNAGANNITVKPDSASGDFLLDQTFATGGLIMNTNFESMVIYANETSRWLIIG